MNTYGRWTRRESPAARGKPIDSAVTILSQWVQSPSFASSPRTSSRTSGRPRGIPSVIGWTKYSYAPKRTTGQSLRLARSRSRAISAPRREGFRRVRGFLEDLGLSLDAATSHQDDAVADHRVDDVTVGRVDPIAHIIEAGRQLGAARIDEDDVREALHADDARVDPQRPRAAEVRELIRLESGQDPRIVGRELLHEARDFHRLEHVEVVVARGPIGPEAHDDRGLLQRRIGHRLARGQLHVRDGTMGDLRARVGEDLDLRGIEPAAVRRDDVLRDEPEAVEVARGTHPGLRHAVVDLAFRLGQVHVDERAIFVGDLPETQEGVLRHRVDRVRAERRRDAVDLHRRDSAVHVLRGPELLDRALGIVEVHDALGEEGPQAHLLHGLRGLVHVEIHVVEGRRPGLDHLEARELRPPVDIGRRELRLGRPDSRLEPRRQVEVVAESAEQRHGRMRVEVHESRERDLSFPVDHCLGFALLPDLRNSISFDVDARHIAFELDVFDQDAHPIRPSAFATTVRVRAAFARCVSRICSNDSGSSTMPWAKLSTVQRDAYGMPSSAARVASEAIVMPTTSPIDWKNAISARVSSRGPVVCTYTPRSWKTAFASFAAAARAARNVGSREGVAWTTRSSKYVGMSQNPMKSSGTTKLPGRIVSFRDPVDDVPRICVAPISFKAQRFARWFSLCGGIRWSFPWRWRNATDTPAWWRTRGGSLGAPWGVTRNFACSSSSMNSSPSADPPMIPMSAAAIGRTRTHPPIKIPSPRPGQDLGSGVVGEDHPGVRWISKGSFPDNPVCIRGSLVPSRRTHDLDHGDRMHPARESPRDGRPGHDDPDVDDGRGLRGRNPAGPRRLFIPGTTPAREPRLGVGEVPRQSRPGSGNRMGSGLGRFSECPLRERCLQDVVPGMRRHPLRHRVCDEHRWRELDPVPVESGAALESIGLGPDPRESMRPP